MSAVGWRAQRSAIATGTLAKTLLQLIAAANQRALVRELQVSFQGTNTTDAPILVEVLRQTNAGTMTGLTLVKTNDSDDETLQTTASHSASAEPTAGDVLDSAYVHPQGQYTFYWPEGLPIKGGGRLGVRVTAAVSVNATVRARGEE